MSEFQQQVIDAIERKMSEQISGDIEVNHSVADQLLLTLIRQLVTDENKEQIERIITTYEAMDKWYA